MGERLLSYRGKDKDGEFLPKPSKAAMEANAKRWRDLHRLVERAWKAKQATAPVAFPIAASPAVASSAKGAPSAYHVTFTKHVAGIKKHGLKTFQTTNWAKAGDKKRYGSGEVYAFEHEHDALRWAAKMDWDHHHQATGTGKISIVKIYGAHDWAEDQNDPLSHLGARGKWLKSRKPIPASSIGDARPLDHDAIQEFMRAG